VQVLSWVGLYDEARRITDVLDAKVDTAQGRHEDAIAATQRKLMFDPDNEAVIAAAADALYLSGRIEESRTLFDRLREFQPLDRPVGKSIATTMRLALVLRRMDDEERAQEASQVARRDHEMRIDAGYVNQFSARDEAMFAAFDDDADTALAAIKTAIQSGLRDPGFFRDPLFDDLRSDPRFVALQKEVNSILVGQRDEVLQVICFNNPVPQAWRPLPETCDGVPESGQL